MKTDRASMAHSLEARVPFLDTVVTDFALALPTRHKVRGLEKKRLLRKAAEPLLPRRIVRGRKRGFSIPAAAWLRGELGPFARELLSPETLRRQGFSSPRSRTATSTTTCGGSTTGAASCGACWLSRCGTSAMSSASQARCRRRASARRSLPDVRVWIDMTASAHVLVFRPLVRILRGRGDEVEITARDYAQTIQLLALHGLEAEVIGRHGGRSRLGKARSLTSRLGALRRWAKGRNFDVALAHGSHELTMTARRLGIPSATTFDYEFAWLQHQLGCRAATKVVVPEAIPPERLEGYGAKPPKLLRYPGLKEEYYLADFEPDEGVLTQWQVDRDRSSSCCARRPTCRSTTAARTRSSRAPSTTSAGARTCRPSCCPEPRSSVPTCGASTCRP